MTSKFSATMIGVQSSNSRNDDARIQYKAEAQQVAQYLQGVHHSKKISHMQVNYPDTTTRLSALQVNSPVVLDTQTNKISETKQLGKNHDTLIQKEQEFYNSMSQSIKSEQYINTRKRLYNREVGRKAVVNEILAGTGPPQKGMIYPQKASHVQILAMTNTLKAPDARIVPPAVPRPKKWLGDGAGWEA